MNFSNKLTGIKKLILSYFWIRNSFIFQVTNHFNLKMKSDLYPVLKAVVIWYFKRRDKTHNLTRVLLNIVYNAYEK